MIIRSQDKKKLIKADKNIIVCIYPNHLKDGYCDIVCRNTFLGEWVLGSYSSLIIALEILDRLEKNMNEDNDNNNIIFEMPQDEEV